MSWTLSFTGNLAVPLAATAIPLSAPSVPMAATDVVQTVTLTLIGTRASGASGNVFFNGLWPNPSLSGSAGAFTLSYTITANSYRPGGTGESGFTAANYVAPRLLVSGGGVAGAIIITSATVTVTTTTDPIGEGPTSGGTPTTVVNASSGTKLEFVAYPPQGAAFATPYTTSVDVVTTTRYADGSASSGRNVGASGSITLTIKQAAGSTTIPFTVSAVTATSHTLTVTGGRATATITIPSTATTGPFILMASGFTGTPKATDGVSPQINFGSLLSQGIVWGTEPTRYVEVGAAYTTFTAVAKNTSLATITGFTGTVTLSILRGGQSDAASYSGTTEVAAVSGVATFSTITFTKAGTYTLSASATGFNPTSTVTVIVTGVFAEDDILGLRQNILYDGTLVGKCTGNPPSPGVIAAASNSELRIIDGDMAATTSVTADGFRFIHPHLIRLQRVDYKVALSTITGTPRIELYTSQDATTISNGTWTLQSSFTPKTAAVQIGAFTLSTPVICKGVYISLHDNGGAATATWRAIHISGPYINPAISWTASTPQGRDVTSENTIGIPVPYRVLTGAQNVTRELIMRNNTSSEYQLAVLHEAARDGGDSLMASQVTLEDENGLALPGQFLLSPYASKAFTIRYNITAAENDNSGKHVGRISLLSYSESSAYAFFVENTGGMEIRTLDDGTLIQNTSTGGTTFHDVAFSAFMTQHMRIGDNGGTEIRIRNGGSLTDSFPAANSITITSAGTASDKNRMIIFDGYVYIFDQTSTTVRRTPRMTGALQTVTLASLATPFSLPAQTTGAKSSVERSANRMWVQNGTAADIVIYDIDTNGSVYNSISTVTNLSGRTINAIIWDPIEEELYVITTVSAGSRLIARYATDGTFVSSTANSDQSGVEATGGGVIGGKLYIMYGGRYMWRYDVQTLANGSELWDGGVNASATGRCRITPL